MTAGAYLVSLAFLQAPVHSTVINSPFEVSSLSLAAVGIVDGLSQLNIGPVDIKVG
jgi:hypothetical protein